MTVLAEKERVARKARRCDGCEGTIRRGDGYRWSKHVRVGGLLNQGIVEYHECPFCAHRYGRSVSCGAVHLPVKLRDTYPCQGIDAKGMAVVWDDLLSEGEGVSVTQDDMVDGVVVRREDGLWIVGIYTEEYLDTVATSRAGERDA